MSTGEASSGLAVTGVLGFPKGADMATEAGTKRVEGEIASRKSKAVWTSAECSLGGPAENTQQEGFGPIPDGIWGSDHLALGVEIGLL